MNLARCRLSRRISLRVPLLAAVLMLGALPALAQNKKGAWEVFLYFGSFYANDIPSASQFGDIRTYRTDPIFAADKTDINHVFTPNLGKVGGDQSGDPNYPFDVPPGDQFSMPPCNGDFTPPTDPNDPRVPYIDECDQDQESRYLYNAGRITTNGEIQRDDSEFTLGIRGGYNITRHWEVELDLGFGKQRVDLTRNLIPLLTQQFNDIADPRMCSVPDETGRRCVEFLKDFYQFTWANADYRSMVLLPTSGLTGEHPSVIASRKADDPNFNIPIYFPLRPDDPNFMPDGETFEDVTGFINRVFLNPTAFRNRGNQINIDNFTISGTVNYNFNTKADSRVIPYVAGGFGRWIRSFDSPYGGDDTNFLTYGAGVRFFVNEIFSFRADARQVRYLEDSFEIRGQLHNFNLQDRVFDPSAGTCVRDNRDLRPPCPNAGDPVPADWAFPDLGGGGGNADISVEAELDDFFEIRLGFDVILGGK